MSNLNRS